jgi:hypothetical protein
VLDTDLARKLAAVILKRGVAERLWKDLTDNLGLLDDEEIYADDTAPKTSAETGEAEAATGDDGADPGPIPECLRRRS